MMATALASERQGSSAVQSKSKQSTGKKQQAASAIAQQADGKVAGIIPWCRHYY